MYILYPCTYNNLLKVDEMYENELKIAKEYGHKILLFNCDDYLFVNRPLVVVPKVEKPIKAIYRGWMMKPEVYERFYADLLKLNIELINNPMEYQNTHCFNYSYELLENYTPKSLFFDKEVDYSLVRENFSRWIMKDYVKSVKGFDFPTFFNSTMSDEELKEYEQKFIALRGDLFTGGICIKEYVDLKKDDTTHEFRAFFYNGTLCSIYHNSDNYGDKLPESFAKHLPKLNSNFYTIDFALLENGEIIVIETGDGQVSGIDNNKGIEELYKNLNFYEEISFFANMTNF